MSMTKAQRAEYRHTFECILDSTRKWAIERQQEMIIYRARNGFWMMGRWLTYEQRKGDTRHIIIYVDGTWEYV